MSKLMLVIQFLALAVGISWVVYRISEVRRFCSYGDAQEDQVNAA